MNIKGSLRALLDNLILKQKGAFLFLMGSVAAFSMPPACFWPMMILSQAVLFFFINTTPTRRVLVINAFMFGCAFGIFSTAWIANALLLDKSYLFLIPILWAGMGFFFGSFYAAPAFLSSFAQPGWRRLTAWASLFCLFEWVRSWLLTGFPWNLVGSCWSDSPLVLQTASLIGVYGLSALTLFCSGVFVLKEKKLYLLGGGLVLILISFGAWRLYHAEQKEAWGVHLRIVQPNIPQDLKWDPKKAEENFSKLIRLSRENNEAVTHVVWPESAVYFIVNTNHAERIRMMQAIRQGGTLITGGLRRTSKTQLANSIFFLDDLANILQFYDKSHLVPFGEYVPFRKWVPFEKIVPIPSDFQEGTGPKTIRIPKTPALGALVCYEVIFSGRVVDKKQRPQWLVNVTNDGWYGISDGPHQHLAAAKMRAVEEGLPLVRAANTGISAVITPYGQIKSSLPLGQEGVLDETLPVPLPATLYSLFGPAIPLCLCVILLFFSYKRKNNA